MNAIESESLLDVHSLLSFVGFGLFFVLLFLFLLLLSSHLFFAYGFFIGGVMGVSRLMGNRLSGDFFFLSEVNFLAVD